MGSPCQESGFVVHLVGGGHIKMMLEATSLSDVQNTLLRQRALIGRHMFVSDHGIEESIPALIPSNRIQMVILNEY